MAYLKANESKCQVKFSLKVSDQQVVLSHEAIQAYFAWEEAFSWKRFRADFPEPSAYARLSRVGLGNDGEKALLYVEYMRGNRAGAVPTSCRKVTRGMRVARMCVISEILSGLPNTRCSGPADSAGSS